MKRTGEGRKKKEKITRCFRCDATGKVCNECGESPLACMCDDGPDEIDCEDCGGTGK